MIGIGMGIGLRTGAGSGAYTPLSLGAKLLDWLDGENAGYDTGTGTVPTWVGRKGVINLAVPSGNTAPTIGAWTTRLRAPQFNGTTDCLRMSSTPAVFGGTTETWIWIVLNHTGAAGGSAKSLISIGVSATKRAQITTNSSVNRFSLTDANAAQFEDTSVAMDGKHVVGGGFLEGGLGYAGRIDSVDTVPANNSITWASTGTAAGSRITVGADNTGVPTRFFTGLIRDIVVTGALTSGERSQLEAWLASRRI